MRVYLMESGEVAIYLFLTCIFASAFLDPDSPVRDLADGTVERRVLMGLAVGARVIAIVTSPIRPPNNDSASVALSRRNSGPFCSI
jgi:hypothetical protein